MDTSARRRRARRRQAMLAAFVVLVMAVGYFLRPHPGGQPSGEVDPAKVLTDLSNKADFAGVLDLGLRSIKSDKPEHRDLGFRAIDTAAVNGYPPAQVIAGKLYDPRSFSAVSGGPEKPFPSAAADWYHKAAAKGSPEGRAELRGLCAYLSATPDQRAAYRTVITRYCN